MKNCEQNDQDLNKKYVQDKQYNHKKYVRLLRSLQIGVGLVTLILGILGTTIVQDGLELYLFTGILCGFFMTEAALASLFILREYSGSDFEGWGKQFRKVGREEAFCVVASWILGITTTIAMVTVDLVLLAFFDSLKIIILAVLELVAGVMLFSVVLVSFWHGLQYRKESMPDL